MAFKGSAKPDMSSMVQQITSIGELQLKQISQLRENNPRIALVFCEQLLSQLEPVKGSFLWLHAQMTYAHVLLYTGHIRQSLNICRTYIQEIDRLGPQGDHLRCMLYAALGYASAFTGDVRDALTYSQKLVDVAQRMNSDAELCRAYLNMGTVHMFFEDYAVAMVFLSRSLALAESCDLRVVQATALDSMGNIHAVFGFWDLAVVYYQRAYLLRKQVQTLPGMAQSLLNIAHTHYSRGEHRRALGTARMALAAARRCGELRVQSHCLALIGEIYAKIGKPKRALSMLRYSHRVWQKLNPGSPGYPAALLVTAEVLSTLNRKRSACRLLERTLELARHHDMPSVAIECSEMLYRLAKAEGDSERALHWFEQIQHWERVLSARIEYEQACRQLLLEAIALMSREHERYRQLIAAMSYHIEQQRQEFAQLLLESALKQRQTPTVKQSLLSKTDGAVNKVDSLLKKVEYILPGYLSALRQQVPTLTPTELLVCALLRLQLRSKEIAELLKISLNTVFHHRENIRHKCGLNTKTNLFVFLCGIR